MWLGASRSRNNLEHNLKTRHAVFALLLFCLLALVRSAPACDDITISPHEQTIMVGDAALFTITGECRSHAPPPPLWKIDYEIVEGDPNGIKVFVSDKTWSLAEEQKYTGKVAVKGIQPGTYKVKFNLESSHDNGGTTQTLTAPTVTVHVVAGNAITVHHKDGNETIDLKVAKWQDSFTSAIPPALKPPPPFPPSPPVYDDWINDDADSFSIRVQDASKSGQGYVYVLVSTAENRDTDYNDPPTKVVLKETEIAGIFTNMDISVNPSKKYRFMLVSDSADDAAIPVVRDPNTNKEEVDNAGTNMAENDRTHKTLPWGKVKVEYPADKPTLTRSYFVEPKKTVKVNVFILKKLVDHNNFKGTATPVIGEGDVQKQWKVVWERCAQVGVWIDWKINVVNLPANINISNPLEMYNPSGDDVSQEVIDLINGTLDAHFGSGVRPPSEQFNFFYVLDILWLGRSAYGAAITSGTYSGNAFMSNNTALPLRGFTAAHELTHCMGVVQHASKMW
jgi:hypothetical protein